MEGGLRGWVKRPHSKGASVPPGVSAGARQASVVSAQRGELAPTDPRKDNQEDPEREGGQRERQGEETRWGRQGRKSEGASKCMGVVRARGISGRAAKRTLGGRCRAMGSHLGKN